MPLIKGKSEKAFTHNIKAEMNAGKPQKQSLAIAYSMKRKAKKMADGGNTSEPSAWENIKNSMSGPAYPSYEDLKHAAAGPANGYAKGGFIDEEKASGYVDHEGNDIKHNGMAMSEDDRDLNQHGEIEEGEQGGGQGFHGESYMGNPGNSTDNYQSEDHEMDMVGKIMKKHQMMYSKGGQVANDGEDELSHMADGKPNNFDDLALRDDDLEGAEYTGANSGDELGNAREDHDEHDIVSRIMKSRAKKDRLPNPR